MSDDNIDLGKIKNNVATMVQKGAPESDIDSYIKNSGTTVDAVKSYKAESKPDVEEPSKGRTAFDQVMQGATYGWSDEMQDIIGAHIASMYTGQPYDDLYHEARERSQTRLNLEQEKHPYISGASNLVGAVALPGLGEAKALNAGGKLATKYAPEALKLGKGGANIAKGIVGGSAGGAAYGAGSSQEGERLSGAEKGAVLGGGTGGLISGGMQGAGKLIAPVFDKAVNLLKNEGVKLTPGQMSSHAAAAVKRAEGALGTIPIVGSSVRSALKDSADSFNIAVLNRALKPIGEKMPKDLSAGREAIEHAESVIGKKYDELLPKLKFKTDAQFIQEAANFKAEAEATLPKKDAKEVEHMWKTNFERRLDKTKGMDGSTFKKVDSELAHKSREYSLSQNPEHKEFARVIDNFRALLRNNISRMNPQYSKELDKIDASWAAFKRAQAASIRRATSNGYFSPADLAAEIKKSSSQGAFARGDGLLQDLSDAANQVLPNTLPGSGTTEQGMWDLLFGGAAATHPAVIPPAIAGYAAYTKPGIAAINKLANPGPVRQAVRSAVENASPAISSGVGTKIGRQKAEPLRLTINPAE